MFNLIFGMGNNQSTDPSTSEDTSTENLQHSSQLTSGNLQGDRRNDELQHIARDFAHRVYGHLQHQIPSQTEPLRTCPAPQEANVLENSELLRLLSQPLTTPPQQNLPIPGTNEPNRMPSMQPQMPTMGNFASSSPVEQPQVNAQSWSQAGAVGIVDWRQMQQEVPELPTAGNSPTDGNRQDSMTNNGMYSPEQDEEFLRLQANFQRTVERTMQIKEMRRKLLGPFADIDFNLFAPLLPTFALNPLPPLPFVLPPLSMVPDLGQITPSPAEGQVDAAGRRPVKDELPDGEAEAQPDYNDYIEIDVSGDQPEIVMLDDDDNDATARGSGASAEDSGIPAAQLMEPEPAREPSPVPAYEHEITIYNGNEVEPVAEATAPPPADHYDCSVVLIPEPEIITLSDDEDEPEILAVLPPRRPVVLPPTPSMETSTLLHVSIPPKNISKGSEDLLMVLPKAEGERGGIGINNGSSGLLMALPKIEERAGNARAPATSANKYEMKPFQKTFESLSTQEMAPEGLQTKKNVEEQNHQMSENITKDGLSGGFAPTSAAAPREMKPIIHLHQDVPMAVVPKPVDERDEQNDTPVINGQNDGSLVSDSGNNDEPKEARDEVHADAADAASVTAPTAVLTASLAAAPVTEPAVVPHVTPVVTPPPAAPAVVPPAAPAVAPPVAPVVVPPVTPVVTTPVSTSVVFSVAPIVTPLAALAVAPPVAPLVATPVAPLAASVVSAPATINNGGGVSPGVPTIEEIPPELQGMVEKRRTTATYYGPQRKIRSPQKGNKQARTSAEMEVESSRPKEETVKRKRGRPPKHRNAITSTANEDSADQPATEPNKELTMWRRKEESAEEALTPRATEENDSTEKPAATKPKKEKAKRKRKDVSAEEVPTTSTSAESATQLELGASVKKEKKKEPKNRRKAHSMDPPTKVNHKTGQEEKSREILHSSVEATYSSGNEDGVGQSCSSAASSSVDHLEMPVQTTNDKMLMELPRTKNLKRRSTAKPSSSDDAQPKEKKAKKMDFDEEFRCTQSNLGASVQKEKKKEPKKRRKAYFTVETQSCCSSGESGASSSDGARTTEKKARMMDFDEEFRGKIGFYASPLLTNQEVAVLRQSGLLVELKEFDLGSCRSIIVGARTLIEGSRLASRFRTLKTSLAVFDGTPGKQKPRLLTTFNNCKYNGVINRLFS